MSKIGPSAAAYSGSAPDSNSRPPQQLRPEDMADRFEVGVQGDLIIVREPTTLFYAIYSKPPDRPQLILHRSRPTKDHVLVAKARQAANEKARELGWIV